MAGKRVKKHPAYRKLKGYQLLKNLPDEEAAAALGLTVRTFREKREGYSDFNYTQSVTLADALGVSLDELFSLA